MSGSYCCFLTCIEVSHEASNVIWYSHLFKNLAQSVVVYTIKGFSVVIKEVNVFLNSLAWTSGISQFTYCWSLAWRMLSITLHSFHMLAVLAESVWYNYFRMLESIETLDFPGEGMDRKLQLILVSFSSQYSSSCPSPNTNSMAGMWSWSNLHTAWRRQGDENDPDLQMSQVCVLIVDCCFWSQSADINVGGHCCVSFYYWQASPSRTEVGPKELTIFLPK